MFQLFDLLILSFLCPRSKFDTRTKQEIAKCNYKWLIGLFIITRLNVSAILLPFFDE